MKTFLSTCLSRCASLLPAAAIIAAALHGGPWPLVALIVMTLWVWGMDKTGLPGLSDGVMKDALPVVVGLAHFATLAAVLWSLRSGWQGLETLATMLAAGLFFGQISNACAHELIHRPQRHLRWLGTAIYCSLLNGQHVSAHLLVHHVWAGTARDPNSAPKGRGFYRFFWTGMVREFLAGRAAECARRTDGTRRWHPYTFYILGAIATLCAAGLMAGLAGLIGLLALALHAQSQLFLSDYVQHYGLRRTTLKNGKPEPMGLRHSWNAPGRYSDAMLLAAPRHSDHHANPGKAYHSLQLDRDAMPMLPASLPVMSTIALIPPLWRRIMDPRVDAVTRKTDVAVQAA
ncbi:MAG: alkane 1-monooxygenase [Roseobacter sp.]